MFCSTSVSIHLLRGAAALALLACVLLFSQSLGTVASVLAVLGAVLLMRGCPMCWLLGLIETIKKPTRAQSLERNSGSLDAP
ncbi:hypothetical protein WG899_04125 [Paucibacter sp. AS339]|uniref:hypothetical protein n=1 Tax=Paucibacter hankyongi TaxID=3133434 RepID=UPI0030B1BA0B